MNSIIATSSRSQVSEQTRAGVVAQSTLSQILAGKRGVSKGTAKKLGAFFGVSSAVFL
jgi:plasmid maintenance system antidote protein VapI